MDPGRGGIAGDCGRRVTSTRLAAGLQGTLTGLQHCWTYCCLVRAFMASGKLPQPIEGQTDAERLRQIAFSEWVLKTEKSELVEREQQRKQQELGAAATTCLLAQQAVTDLRRPERTASCARRRRSNSSPASIIHHTSFKHMICFNTWLKKKVFVHTWLKNVHRC